MKNQKVYCNDCEYMRTELLGLCEGANYWCGIFDEKKDNWWGVSIVHKIKCKKQNKNNDCIFFSHR